MNPPTTDADFRALLSPIFEELRALFPDWRIGQHQPYTLFTDADAQSIDKLYGLRVCHHQGRAVVLFTAWSRNKNVPAIGWEPTTAQSAHEAVVQRVRFGLDTFAQIESEKSVRRSATPR